MVQVHRAPGMLASFAGFSDCREHRSQGEGLCSMARGSFRLRAIQPSRVVMPAPRTTSAQGVGRAGQSPAVKEGPRGHGRFQVGASLRPWLVTIVAVSRSPHNKKPPPCGGGFPIQSEAESFGDFSLSRWRELAEPQEWTQQQPGRGGSCERCARASLPCRGWRGSAHQPRCSGRGPDHQGWTG